MSKIKPSKKHTDIKNDHILIQIAPHCLKPYLLLARLDRPIGIWLLLLPALWSITMAAGGVMDMNVGDFKIAGLFCIGAVLMRAAGCVINDLWDRDLDKKVSRTAARPLAAGDVTPRQAIIFLGLLLISSFVILLQMNFITILLGILAMPLIIAYPLMKRITWWPQAFLGLTFNFGALMGYAAINITVSMPAILLYISGVFWTLGYDTIYAHQDKEDDATIGIKSSALKLGQHSKKWVKRFYIASALLLIAAITVNQNDGYITSLYILPGILYLIWMLRNWDEERPESALETFKGNYKYGVLILLGLLLA